MGGAASLKSSEATTYYLSETFMGGVSVEISNTQAKEIYAARQLTLAFLEVEELYSLVAGSFYEFEEFMIGESLRDLTGFYVEQDNFAINMRLDTVRETLNLKLLNILTAYRTYCDHCPQRLQKAEELFPDALRIHKETKSDAFDERLEFRIFDALRNYAQHASLPISNVTFSLSRQRALDEPNFRIRNTVEPTLDARKLQLDKSIRPKTRSEIEHLDVKYLSTKAIVRGFISSLGKSRDRFNNASKSALENSKQVFEEAYGFVRDAKGAEAKFVSLVSEDGTTITLKQELPDLVMQRRLRWRRLTAITDHYASSDISKSADTFNGY